MPEFDHQHNWQVEITAYGDPERTRAQQEATLNRRLSLEYGAEVRIRPLEGNEPSAGILADRVRTLEHACRAQFRTGACREIVEALGLRPDNGKPPVVVYCVGCNRPTPPAELLPHGKCFTCEPF